MDDLKHKYCTNTHTRAHTHTHTHTHKHTHTHTNTTFFIAYRIVLSRKRLLSLQF